MTTSNTSALPSAALVAAHFSEVLREWLTPDEMYEVNKTNRANGYSSDVCASGDHCDSNMAMDAALSQLGVEIFETVNGEEQMRDDVLALWNEAWGIAKENHFKRELFMVDGTKPAFKFKEAQVSSFLTDPEGGGVYDPKGDGFSPAVLGFNVHLTGGGCTAWRQEFVMRGRHVFILLTTEGASHEIEPNDDLVVGVYLDEWEGQDDVAGDQLFIETIAAPAR